MAHLDLINPGVENLNVSENDCEGDSLPECLILSEALQDPYDSDIWINGKKEKMLNDIFIPGSDITPWELKHFLKFGYDSFFGKFPMENIKAECLLENAFTMFFPKGIPACYINKHVAMENDESMESIVSKFYRKFLKSDTNKWLIQHFHYDFNKVNVEDIPEIHELLIKSLLENGHMLEDLRKLNAVYNLAGRFTDVMECLIKDEKRPKNPVDDCDESKKQLVKGLVYQMMAYLGIQVMFNSEGRYDFQHLHIPDRIQKEPVSFRIEPDASLFVRTEKGRLPFGVVKVHTPYCVKKVRKCSTEDSILSSPTSRADEKKEKDVDVIPEEDPGIMSDTPNVCKDYKNLNEPSGDVRNKMKSLSISKEKAAPSVDIQASVTHVSTQTAADNMSVLTGNSLDSSQGSAYSSVYKRYKKHDINNAIRGKGPIACDTDLVFTKFYGQLPIEMYGMLIERDQVLQKAFGCQESPLVGLGLFAMNETIYLVKITDVRENLPGSNQQCGGPTVTYAKNFWFNLRNPGHRSAFLCFMFYYYEIQISLNFENTYQRLAKLREKADIYALLNFGKSHCRE